MQPTLPKRHKAVVVTGTGKLAVQDDRPVPVLAPGEVLVKVVAVAINPVDAKMLDFSPTVGSVAGDVCLPALPFLFTYCLIPASFTRWSARRGSHCMARNSQARLWHWGRM